MTTTPTPQHQGRELLNLVAMLTYGLQRYDLTDADRRQWPLQIAEAHRRLDALYAAGLSPNFLSERGAAAHGARPDNDLRESVNNRPFDSFRSLALDEDAEGMAAMLDGGFDVNTPNAAHETVLMHCCANNRQRGARLLVARGADVNLSDLGGTTAMDFALRHASPAFCGWLERAGGRTGGPHDYSHPRGPR